MTKKLISLPDDVIDEIRQEAQRQDRTFSALIRWLWEFFLAHK